MKRGSTTSGSSVAVVEHVQLRPLVAAGVDLDEHAAVRQEEARDRLGEVRQLLELAAARRQRVELVRARECSTRRAGAEPSSENESGTACRISSSERRSVMRPLTVVTQ